MTELRFNRELYQSELVDQAAKVYAHLASVEVSQDASSWVVKVGAGDSAREKKIAGELANYALGLTVQSRAQATR